MGRVLFFVDGFNVYHALDDLSLHRFKWLNLRKLAHCLIRSKDQVADILYFTTFVTWNPLKLARHRDYVSALRSVGVRLALGQFRRRDRRCPSCRATCRTFEEKQTDVNIALHLFRAAIDDVDVYDVAVIVSGDSDLIPAIQAVTATFPGRQVRVVIPIGRSAEDLKRVADFHMRMKRKQLQSSPFDDVDDVGGGRQVRRPFSSK